MLNNIYEYIYIYNYLNIITSVLLSFPMAFNGSVSFVKNIEMLFILIPGFKVMAGHANLVLPKAASKF